MKQDPQTYDTVIAGGGMVGMTAAIALASAGISCAVIELVPAPGQLLPQFDGRVSAIALGSQRLLSQLGIWPTIAPYAEPILDIRVVDNHSSLFLHYDHHEVGNEPFGWIVENRHIREALFTRAASLKDNLTVYAPAKALQSDYHNTHAAVTLNDGKVLRCQLVLAADGRFSKTREQAGIKATTLPYNQTAIVCTISHSLPHNGLALERFLPIGPFAVLPMQGNRSSLVWTESKERAELLLTLSDMELAEEITRRTGKYLGEIRVEGTRFSYPLTLVHAAQYTGKRLALIGDAAHGIHPIAGQGVNLGFRDVAALAEIVIDAHRLGLDLGFEPNLFRYARWRSFDAFSMVAVTDILNRLFSNNILPFKIARRSGLAAVGSLPPLKRFFMRHAMGVVGDLPRLMQQKK